MAGTDVEPGTHPTVAIKIAYDGTTIAELYPEVAPITVENFLTLVDEKFYDGLTFHRISSILMIPGGYRLVTAPAAPMRTSRANSARMA